MRIQQRSSMFGVAMCALMVLGGSLAQAREGRLIEFAIKDQFHVVHKDEDYVDRVVVVIGSDKHGSSFNSLWGQAIHDILSDVPGYDDIDFLPVADVRGVPFFVKGHVRKKFPREREKWALVDWDGEFAKAYAWVPRHSNIQIFDRSGALILHEHGTEVDAATLQRIVDALRPLLHEDATVDDPKGRASEDVTAEGSEAARP